MRKYVLLVAGLLGYVFVNAQSIDPVSLVIAKVIKAIDLQVQKIQNETIWLQQAQQVAEHALSRLKLGEIKDWEQKREKQYEDYFREIKTVKAVIKVLPQVKQIIAMQAAVSSVYKQGVNSAEAIRLVTLSKEILQSLAPVVSGQDNSMKDVDRVLLLCHLRNNMSDCLDSMQRLNNVNDRIGVRQSANARDLKIFQQLNAKP